MKSTNQCAFDLNGTVIGTQCRALWAPLRIPHVLRKNEMLTDAIAELTKAHRARLVVDGKRKEIEINPALLKVH
jgi:hypothetical protein